MLSVWSDTRPPALVSLGGAPLGQGGTPFCPEILTIKLLQVVFPCGRVVA